MCWNYQIFLHIGHGEVDRPPRLAAAGQLLSQTEAGGGSALAVVGGAGVAHQLLLSVQPGALYHQERTESRPAKQLEMFKLRGNLLKSLLNLNWGSQKGFNNIRVDIADVIFYDQFVEIFPDIVSRSEHSSRGDICGFLAENKPVRRWSTSISTCRCTMKMLITSLIRRRKQSFSEKEMFS